MASGPPSGIASTDARGGMEERDAARLFTAVCGGGRVRGSGAR